MRFYLAHPFADRKGIRESELAFEKSTGIDLLNPFYDTGRGDVLAIDAGKQSEEAVDFRHVVEGDIADIKRCDGLVAVLTDVPMIGTIMEIVYANMAGKKVYVLDFADKQGHPWIRYHADSIVVRWDELAVVLSHHEGRGNMPSGLTVENFWNGLITFNDKYFPGWRKRDLVYYSNALAGEVGEFCNATKHLAGGGTNQKQPTQPELVEELADAFIYITMAAERLGVDQKRFVMALWEKMDENQIRMEARRREG